MKRFVALYDALDATTSTNEKVRALVAYFSSTPPEDAVWGLWFLTGHRPKRLVPMALLQRWTQEVSGVPPWLFAESYSVVGDLAETISLLLESKSSTPAAPSLSLATWMTERILPLRGGDELTQREAIVSWWRELDARHVYVVTKLLTGSFRVGVSATLVARALAEHLGLTPPVVAHRLMGSWAPTAAFFLSLGQEDSADADQARPYPFFLASPLEQAPETLGDVHLWQAEWKWDGIRAQLVRRQGQVALWSRGEEFVTDRFPEIRDAAAGLPDNVVIDGEILAYRDGAPLPFALLQQRIGRQKPGAKILADAPVVLMAYDLLEEHGADRRAEPLSVRRARLESIFKHPSPVLQVSPILRANDWNELTRLREQARAGGVEGLMLKHMESAYGTGRRRGEWWKWKVDPYTLDAVLLYAQAGHGRRANLFTDYTFAVWDGPTLVPVAKAYSGLTDEEIARLDAWVRAHTKDKFGPVRAVEPVQVFELAFEGIRASPRHKSGVAFRFPRILRWRTDKPAAEADSLATVRALLEVPLAPAASFR